VSGTRQVAVVIPSWNSRDLLPGCLGSLARQGGELEILVVDNGSRDGSPEYLREKGVECLALPRNLGFAAAVNLGIARTAARSVLVLNADTVLEPGCVDELDRALGASADLAGVQPRILQLEPERRAAVDDARLYSAGQALTRDGRAIELGAGEEQAPRYLAGREIFGVCGAACLFRREAFERLGGYDESYESFYEDVDLNVRARVEGLGFEYVPEAVVWHLGNASWQQGFEEPAAENARLVARNRIATQAKFMPVGSLPRILAVEAGALARSAKRRRLRATFAGKLAGIGRLPRSLRERRRLGRRGELSRARAWLGRGSGV
jgi:GT2 family glycosyltransferase